MLSRQDPKSRLIATIAAMSILGANCIQASHAESVEQDAAAHSSWRASMAHHTNAQPGCFAATYPSLVWEKVACMEGDLTFQRAVHRATAGGTAVTGNGNDYVAEAAGLISETVGTFPSVSGIKAERTAGVTSFGGGGVLGPNEYTLQINTNNTGTTDACAGRSGCTVWQQFIYGTNFPFPKQPMKFDGAVYMEYWLLNWGSDCPFLWQSFDGDCVRNSAYLQVPNFPIKGTALENLTLSGSAVAGGNDTVVLSDGTTAYSITEPDSTLDVASAWTQSEFNVVGDSDGSEAIFNKGSSITVNVALTDGSNTAPTCLADAGSTGETNNLILGGCTAAGGASPSIQFTESN